MLLEVFKLGFTVLKGIEVPGSLDFDSLDIAFTTTPPTTLYYIQDSGAVEDYIMDHSGCSKEEQEFLRKLGDIADKSKYGLTFVIE